MEQLRSALTEGEKERIASSNSPEDACSIARNGLEAEAERATAELLGPGPLSKDAHEAEQTRADGNAKVSRGDYQGAAEAYTRAAQKSPLPSHHLAASFANRAEALLRDLERGNHEDGVDTVGLATCALQDSNRALAIDPFAAKAMYRRARAEHFLGRDSQSEQDFCRAKAMAKSGEPVASEPSPSSGERSEGMGRGCSVMTWKVRQEAIPAKGNALVATEGMEPGRVVLREEPFATVVNKAHRKWRCFNCLRVLGWSPVPCKSCAYALFCSEECRADASVVHEHECHGNAWVAAFPENLVLAAKCFVQLITGCESLQSRFWALASGWWAMGKDERIERTVAAFALSAVLRASFDEQATPELVLNIDARTKCNAFSVVDHSAVALGNSASEPPRVGAGIYLASSSLNHSCSPNAHVSFDGKVACVRSVESVPACGEVTISYGPELGREPSWQRNKTLRLRYGFSCACEACSSEGRHRHDALLTGLECPACCGLIPGDERLEESSCSACGEMISASEKEEFLTTTKAAEEDVQRARQLMDRRAPEKALEALARAQKGLNQVAHPESRRVAEMSDGMAHALSELGRLEESYAWGESSLAILRRHYGERNALALAHEAAKMAEVAHEAGQVERASRLAREARDKMALHYGDEAPVIGELEQFICTEEGDLWSEAKQ